MKCIKTELVDINEIFLKDGGDNQGVEIFAEKDASSRILLA